MWKAVWMGMEGYGIVSFFYVYGGVGDGRRGEKK